MGSISVFLAVYGHEPGSTAQATVAGLGRVRPLGSWRAECGRGSIVPADGSREEVIVREGYGAADIAAATAGALVLACVATILEMPIEQLPQLPGDGDPATGWVVSRWLGGRGLGIARVAEPTTFSWPGPWLARVCPPAGPASYVVMHGVPSGPNGGGRAHIRAEHLRRGHDELGADRPMRQRVRTAFEQLAQSI